MEGLGLFVELLIVLFGLAVFLIVATVASVWLWTLGRRGRTIWAACVVVLAVTGIAGVATLAWAVNRTIPQTAFTAAAWNAGDDEARGAMTDDPVANHVVGLTEAQLLALLGPPDRIDRGEGGLPGVPIQYQYVVPPFFTAIRITLEPGPGGAMVVTGAQATRGMFQY